MKKILVLYGGKSVEHDISIITALQAMNAVRNDVELLPVYITGDGEFVTAKNLLDVNIYSNFNKFAKGRKNITFHFGKGCVVARGKLSVKKFYPDVALTCNHGANGEDGMISALMEFANIPYTCPNVESSCVCMDKEIAKIVLASHDVPVTDFVCGDGLKLADILQKISFPIIVKPCRCGSSVGITKCNNIEELKKSVEIAKNYDKKLIFEHFFEKCREFNCACLCKNERYITSKVCEVKGQGLYSFEEKYITEKPSTTFKIEKEIKRLIERLTIKTCEALECDGIVRVDFLMDSDGKLYVNEVNTIPGSLSFYMFSNMKEVVFELIDAAIERHNSKNEISYNHDSSALQVFAKANKYAKK